MRKKKTSVIQKQYRYDKERNSYLIEVQLDDYDDVYDEWDPAPFKKRDIEEEFHKFIVASAEDIPSKYGLILVLHLPEEKQDTHKENAIILACQNFYNYETEIQKRTWLRLRERTIHYFLLAITLLAVGYFFITESDNLVLNVLREGVFIGGWVFLWEVVTNLFIVRREMKQKGNLFQRLLQAEIRFIYQ